MSLPRYILDAIQPTCYPTLLLFLVFAYVASLVAARVWLGGWFTTLLIGAEGLVYLDALLLAVL